MQQWDPVIRAVVAACNGNARAVQELEPFLNDVEKEDDWRNLVLVIRRIMQGERGVELMEGLDVVDATIVRRILGLLAGHSEPSPQAAKNLVRPRRDPSPRTAQGDTPGGGSSEGEGITVEDILNLVVAGAKGDQQAGGQAYQIAQALQQDRNAPPEIRALGKGLQNVLEGLRGDEAVRGLPPEAAELVRVGAWRKCWSVDGEFIVTEVSGQGRGAVVRKMRSERQMSFRAHVRTPSLAALPSHR